MAVNQWDIEFEQGAEFQSAVTISTWPASYPALATATEWRLSAAQSGQLAFLTASSIGASPMITLNGAKTVGTIKVPAATTLLMPLGSAKYDLDIHFPGSVVKRIISLGNATVVEYAGAV